MSKKSLAVMEDFINNLYSATAGCDTTNQPYDAPVKSHMPRKIFKAMWKLIRSDFVDNLYFHGDMDSRCYTGSLNILQRRIPFNVTYGYSEYSSNRGLVYNRAAFYLHVNSDYVARFYIDDRYIRKNRIRFIILDKTHVPDLKESYETFDKTILTAHGFR